jgi:predicted aldo/keto reductase-like oxidoreductase
MEKRRLGRTGHMSTVVIFGSAAFGNIEQDAANKILDMVLAAGITHIDIAPGYGQAEVRTGPWLKNHRDKFFLGCKTEKREKVAAWTDLHNSLALLNTEKLDLYQLHAVGTLPELDMAMSSGGSFATLLEAKEQGLTKYLGITGHGMHAPAVHSIALDRYDFDTVMFPIYPTLFANANYRRDTMALLKKCEERNVGVMIIKSAAKQAWGDRERTHTTWYEPHNQQDKIDTAIRFALSQPAVTGVASAGDINVLPMVIKAAEKFTPMSESEQEALIEESKNRELFFVPEGQ